jgi:hypothetical protein
MRILTIISLLFLHASCGSKNYEVLKEETSMNVCRLQVKLEKKESETELENIAKELREDRKSYDKLWISFFQPDLLTDKSGNGAWAMASFTPELEIDILGENQPLIDNENQVTEVAGFPNYPTISEMLEASGDYTGKQVELLDSNPENTHVRVSSEFLNDESESLIIEQVKRDIVYVVFQTFAQTDLDKITVTSIPIIRASFNPNLEYDGKLQESKKEKVSITRVRATEIIKKFLETDSFKDLYQLNSTLYLPNEKFDRLKHGELNNVFVEMRK